MDVQIQGHRNQVAGRDLFAISVGTVQLVVRVPTHPSRLRGKRGLALLVSLVAIIAWGGWMMAGNYYADRHGTPPPFGAADVLAFWLVGMVWGFAGVASGRSDGAQ